MGKKKQTDKNSRKLTYNQEDDASFRKAQFFENFKAEAPHIRDEILRELPALNTLLSLQAESFDDISLRVIAKQRGVPYDPCTPPTPDCPSCKQHDKVVGKGRQGYHCQRCRKSFRASHNSLVSDKKISDLLFVQVVTAILNGYGQTRTCDMTGVAPLTYIRIRNKVFYALQLLLNSVYLSGVIQADCTFVRISYKGLDLQESEFDDSSIFYDKTAFIPREDRKRGGPFSKEEHNANSLCILSLIDEYGKCRNIMCGTGLASMKTFKMFVPNGLIRLTVPEEEPFTLLKKSKRTPERKPGDPSLLVIDGELALESYAKHLGLEYESHVYRKNGVQRTLPEGAHDIQRINALHSRLKKFLRSSPISSKYLPGFLLLFDALDMTGGSDEMKKRVLEIMATPGLDQPPKFFQQLFSVPNYLELWFSGDHPLKKLPYRQLLAFYLYDHIRNKEQYPGIEITMSYIRKRTGYSDKYIRRSYYNLLNAKYRDLILEYFGEEVRLKNNNIPPIIPILHEEWAAYVRGEKGPRPSFEKFVKVKNKQHNLVFTPKKLSYWFSRVEELDVCSPIPPREEWVPTAPDIPQEIFVLYDEWNDYLRNSGLSQPALAQFYREKVEQCGLQISYERLRKRFEDIQILKVRDPLPENERHKTLPTTKQQAIFDDFETIRKEQKQLGKAGMNVSGIQKLLGQKYNVSPYTIAKSVRKVRNYQSAISLSGSTDERAPRVKSDDGAMPLSEFNPAAAARWHPTKNGELTPDQVTYGSDKYVWWLCPICGHEWQALVRLQSRKLRCPMCEAGNSGCLAEDKELSAQWHPTKNGERTPYHYSRFSGEKVWWICNKGHEWESTISHRSEGGRCPICANRKVLPGYNDLASRFPEIAAQWHPTKNGSFTPEQVPYGSGKDAWWLCPDCGYEWKTSIHNRTRHRSGCQRCVDHTVQIPDKNANLATLRQDLAAQWHPTNNGALTPADVTPGSGRKVWWICEKGHEWEAHVGNRVRGSGCPHCAREAREAKKKKRSNE